MATPVKSDTQTKASSLSKQLLETRKTKESCPLCEQPYLYTNDAEAYDDIVHYSCLNCGHVFYENDEQRKRRKGKKKDKNQNPWPEGFLVLIAMLATIAAINSVRENESQRPRPAATSPIIELTAFT